MFPAPARQPTAQPTVEPATAHGPAAAAPGRAAMPWDASPRLVAQRRRWQHAFPAGAVLQGYFIVNEQRTDDADQFAEDASQAQKEAQVWLALEPALQAAWQSLPQAHYDAALIAEMRTKLLAMAFSNALVRLATVAAELERVAVERIEARKPLSDRASPAGVGGSLGPVPTLGEKEKHSTAVYTRTGATGATSTESFDSDAYTKGPSRRTREGKGGLATTPKGTAQAWTVEAAKKSIRAWTCEAPLARHLALTIWPLLGDTDEGRRWEVKFREIDRLVTFRDAEGQSRFIEVQERRGGKKVKSLDRRDYTAAARKAMKDDILAGTPHPAEQQGVLFYDRLLKAAAGADAVVADSDTFALQPAYTVTGDLSMILTHWRPILYFDWILAEDVLNNASNA